MTFTPETKNSPSFTAQAINGGSFTWADATISWANETITWAASGVASWTSETKN